MSKGPIGKILPPEIKGTGLPDNEPDQLRLPTLDERAKLYLRAVHGERDFTDQEHSAARDRILDEMAANIAAESGGHSRDPDAPGLEGIDFPPGAVATASASISDEDLNWPNADYSASEAPPAHARLSPVVAFRSVPLSESAIPDTLPPPGGQVEVRYFASISQNRLRPQLTEPRRWPVAKRQMFMAATAIAATIFLVAGAYRLVLVSTEEAKRLHTAFAPIGADSRVQLELAQACPGSSNEVALRQRRIESCAETATGPTQPASQNPNTALLRAPNSPLAASAGGPKNGDAIADIIRRGRALTASGQILAARFALKEVADADIAEAALALGMTYDPMELENLGVRNVLPEPDAARRWYQKAKDLGSTEAQGRLERLAAREGQAR